MEKAIKKIWDVSFEKKNKDNRKPKPSTGWKKYKKLNKKIQEKC